MKKNVGKVDKMVRIILAVILITLYFTNVVTGTLGIISLVVSAIALITALINFCAIYPIFGISTHKKEE